jgi:glycosyltransferase involved in cell wall biosynthesis
MRPNTVAYFSTYPPRECGIATFTRDLATAFDERFNPLTASRIIALNETQTSLYRYPERVADTIAANNLEHYVELAERLNRQDAVKIISVQHEFGIFGGRWGDYLVPFLQVVKKPVVVTFHSVLPNPEDDVKRSVQLVATYAKALVVMNARSRDMLVETYGVPRYKIKLIPHGIPDVTFEPPRAAKEALGFEGKLVLSTFGMLSRNKGIEQVIRAMPRIVSRFPNAVYLVLGETHPVVRRGEGEIYRNFLSAEVERLRLMCFSTTNI